MARPPSHDVIVPPPPLGQLQGLRERLRLSLTFSSSSSPSVLERQLYLLGYSAGISVVSPMLTAYQLCKVYNKPMSLPHLARLSVRIWPHQILLKWVQMNAATPVKEHLNPWMAFAVVGMLQGGVYGQCNVHFSRVLGLSQTANLKGMFRGLAFAACRDCLSQGMPFVLSPTVQRLAVDPLLKPVTGDGQGGAEPARRGLAVFSTSVLATVLSQCFHNCQIKMQADQSLSYGKTVRLLWKEHGARLFYVGAPARILLLLVVNALNDLLLRRAWK